MRRSLPSLIQKKNSPQHIVPNRRNFLFGAAAAFTASRTNLLAAALAPLPDHTGSPLKIEAVELLELHGRYTDHPDQKKSLPLRSISTYEPQEGSTVSTAPSKRARQSSSTTSFVPF